MAPILALLRTIVGRPTIHPVPFAITKLTLTVVLLAPALHVAGVRIRSPLHGLAPLAVALLVASFIVVVLAGRVLGRSARIGLPDGATELATTGIYRFCRHPMYLAIFLYAGASCLLCPHPAVLASAIVTCLLHHRIALAEETFLAERFGAVWLEHMARTPRYVGLPH